MEAEAALILHVGFCGSCAGDLRHASQHQFHIIIQGQCQLLILDLCPLLAAAAHTAVTADLTLRWLCCGLLSFYCSTTDLLPGCQHYCTARRATPQLCRTADHTQVT